MNIPSNTQDETTEKSNQLTPERCRQCDDIFPIEDADPNYEGIVSTHSNDSYCKFTCVTEPNKSK